jgi:leucyl/phenylalanyl-tRNA---protein transferase
MHPMHAPTASVIDPDLLLLAYRSGIFPMADSRDDPEVFWVEPRRRAILPLDGFQCSGSLARTLRRGRFRVSCNHDFGAVMQACAAARSDDGGTWISHRIEASYRALHDRGLAHSLECWQGEDLVGGLYGVGFNRVFCGESMFSRASDASKVALAWLVAALQRGGAELLDCQFLTGHLESLGAIELDQSEYLARLRRAQRSSDGRAAGEGCGAGVAADADGAGAAFGAGGRADADTGAALPAGFAALLAEAAGAGLSSSPGKRIAQSFTQTS